MKKSILSICMIIFSMAACKKATLLTYSSSSSIYFTEAVSNNTDTSLISFGFSLPVYTDSVVLIPVSVTGSPADHDRTFTLVADASSNAVAGVHYKALESSYKIRAGHVTDTVQLTLYRTPDMKTTSVTLNLALQSGPDFNTNMQRQGDTTSISFVNFRLMVNDIVTQPALWPVYTLGKFSPKKMYLVCQLGDFDPIIFTDSSLYDQYAVLSASLALARYLQQQQDAGTPVLYEDGTPMAVND